MIAGYISPFAHAPYTANKKDADYSESDIADHNSPRPNALQRNLLSEDGNSRIQEHFHNESP
jgi:hypothetical protein